MPENIRLLEVLRLSAVDRVILQRPLCESPGSCENDGDAGSSWGRWYRGFFQAAMKAFRPNATVYWRSSELDKTLKPVVVSSYAENSSTIVLQPEMCFGDTVIRLVNGDSLYRSMSRVTTARFRQEAYTMSGIESLPLPLSLAKIFATSDSRPVVTIVYRDDTGCCLRQNIESFANELAAAPNSVVVNGTENAPSSIAAGSNSGVIIRLVNTANKMQLDTFESYVRICVQSHIVIAEHGAFQSNIILMREGSLMIDLSDDSFMFPRIPFERLADVFGVHFRNVPVKDSHKLITRAESNLLKNTVFEFLIDLYNKTELVQFLSFTGSVSETETRADVVTEALWPKVSYPVIYICFGKPPDFMAVIEELALRKSNVVVVSDYYLSRNVSLSVGTGLNHFLVHEPVAPYLFGTKYFRKIYKHLHKDQSPRKYLYELGCYVRWFVLRDFTRLNSIPAAVMADTYSAIFISARELFETRSSCDAVLSVQAQDHWTQWVASGHTSLWKLPALEEYW